MIVPELRAPCHSYTKGPSLNHMLEINIQPFCVALSLSLCLKASASFNKSPCRSSRGAIAVCNPSSTWTSAQLEKVSLAIAKAPFPLSYAGPSCPASSLNHSWKPRWLLKVSTIVQTTKPCCSFVISELLLPGPVCSSRNLP